MGSRRSDFMGKSPSTWQLGQSGILLCFSTQGGVKRNITWRGRTWDDSQKWALVSYPKRFRVTSAWEHRDKRTREQTTFWYPNNIGSQISPQNHHTFSCSNEGYSYHALHRHKLRRKQCTVSSIKENAVTNQDYMLHHQLISLHKCLRILARFTDTYKLICPTIKPPF